MEVTPVRPGRQILGAAAVLLPIDAEQHIDWTTFAALVERTVAAGLIPAVNMDTGYLQLLADQEREQAVTITAEIADTFCAGVFVDDSAGDAFDLTAYSRGFETVAGAGGTPVIFPSWGLNSQTGDEWVASLAAISGGADFIGFELGEAFVPYGRIFDLATYVELMRLPNCLGAKHSSLSRLLEWERLAARDEHRPDFRVFTGNDLAIDMVMYGSDYLLGLAAAAPDAFSRRDAMWVAGDPRFHELNDLLQYLGAFAFRRPVPAYKHSIARFLQLRGWIPSPNTHPGSPERDSSEEPVLADIAERLDDWMSRE
jgi:dihydrodipicolinate synthase/N-acetylneuraminate lyase